MAILKIATHRKLVSADLVHKKRGKISRTGLVHLGTSTFELIESGFPHTILAQVSHFMGHGNDP